MHRAECAFTHSFSWGSGELVALKSPASRRTVPLPPRLIAILQDHLAELQHEAQRRDPWNSMGLLFCSKAGTPLSQRNVLRVWDRLLKRAGVEHRGFHHLRHTYGTALAERGVHERVAQELLGHADSRTTREIYTHTTSRMNDAAVAAVADALEEALGSPIGSPSRKLRGQVRCSSR